MLNGKVWISLLIASVELKIATYPSPPM